MYRTILLLKHREQVVAVGIYRRDLSLRRTLGAGIPFFLVCWIDRRIEPLRSAPPA